MGIDAFVLGAQPVECLAVLALHAFAPIRDANTVTLLRRIGVGAMLVLRRRAPQLDIFGMGPLDVVVFSKAAIDQIVGGLVAFSLHRLDPRLCQTAIRAAGIDVDRGDHLVFRRRYKLHVISRTPPAIGHLHHPRVGIGGRTRGSFCLATCFLLVFSRRSRSASSSFMRSCAAAIRATRSRAPRSFAARWRRSPAAGSISTSARRRFTRACAAVSRSLSRACRRKELAPAPARTRKPSCAKVSSDTNPA